MKKMKTVFAANTIRVFLSILVLAAMLLSFSACGDTPASETTTGEDTTAVPSDPGPALVADGKIAWNVIRSSDASNSLVTSATDLYKLLCTLTGTKGSYSEDFLTRNTADNDNPEILIGSTNRPISTEVRQTLKTQDWYIGMKGNKILIVGGSDDATVKAIESFSEMLNQAYDGASDPAAVTLDFLKGEYTYTAEYTGKVIKIAGNSLDQYSVCYMSTSASGAPAGKDKLISTVSQTLGFVMNSYNSSKKTDTSDLEIVIGDCTSREGAVGLADKLTGTIPYGITCTGGRLFISGKDSWGINAAVNKFMEFVYAGTDIEEGYSFFGDAKGTTLFDLSAGADIRVMTNNVWKCDSNQTAWKNKGEDCSAAVRSKGFAAYYIAFKPDIVNLQEMSTTMINLILNEMKAAGLNYKRLQASPDDTPILYNADTLKMIDNGQHLYAYGNNGNSKGYHWALFEHLATGTKFLDLSTHLWWKSESAEAGSDSWRYRQCEEIVALSEKLIAQYQCPMIMAGDLNMNISAEAYSVLTKGDFKDCFDIASAKDNTHGHHACNSDGYSTTLYSGTYSTAIDHMLMKNYGSWKVLCFRQTTADFYWKLSDHIPAYVDIQFN